MNLEKVMTELEALGTERTKKKYLNNGAKEPVFGVTISAMKPLFKKYKYNQALANELFDTGNYDAMYLAGMIAEPEKMTEAAFDNWIDKAYFYMISDFIVAVTLAETEISFASAVSNRWIESGSELTMSAGWSCYEWLLGSRKDTEFEVENLRKLIHRVAETIHNQPNRTKIAMNNFIIAVGISYKPLHKEALTTAQNIGEVEIIKGGNPHVLMSASKQIQVAIEKEKIGFKRKNVRC